MWLGLSLDVFIISVGQITVAKIDIILSDLILQYSGNSRMK